MTDLITPKTLAEAAAEKIKGLIKTITEVRDGDSDTLLFDTFALPIAKNKKGIHLFDDDYNGKKDSIFLLSDGQLVRTLKPLLVGSVLELISELTVATEYGANDCCVEIERAILHLRARCKKGPANVDK